VSVPCSEHEADDLNISVFGLGYVGAVSAVCLAKSGHTITGVDTNQYKVDSLRNGVSPIVEPGVDELLRQVLESGRLTATTDAVEAVHATDISLICVGTPSNANGSLHLDAVMRVAGQIGAALKAKPAYHGIVVRSTVLPGTVDKVASVVERASGKSNGEGFGIASNPEFLREGTSIDDFENPPYTVVGTEDARMEELLRNVYHTVNAPFFRVHVRESELLKYACNSFHAVKVAFGNEIGAISKKLGIDSHVVMKIFSEDTKLNISPYYLKPGFAFGGSCLPKDVRALTYESRLLDVPTPLLDSVMPSNHCQVQRVVDWVLERKRKNVGILGLSFKSDTDDLRESPIVSVVETLIGKGYKIAIYDANVNISKLVGANRSYIEQEIPHISLLMKSSVQDVLGQSDCVIISNKGAEFRNVPALLRSGQVVLDLVRVSGDGKTSNGSYEGISW
jgi:GDP-mannose 6-dehydrogenase